MPTVAFPPCTPFTSQLIVVLSASVTLAVNDTAAAPACTLVLNGEIVTVMGDGTDTAARHACVPAVVGLLLVALVGLS